MRFRLVLAMTLLLPMTSGCSSAQPTGPSGALVLERTIPLPNTRGRIDHLGIDLDRRFVFVAEVAQGTVDEVDLQAGKVIGRISGLSGPQGVAWLPRQRELVVACDDGSVHFYESDLKPVTRIDLGGDADNVRIDPRNGHVVVGYGSGGLAIIDPASHSVLSRVPLPAHPEGFQLSGARAYINVPDNGAVIAADIDQKTILSRWPTGWHRLNFPMAIDPTGRSITIAYRLPAALASIDTSTGQTTRIESSCGDADDVFLTGQHVLQVCGAGHVDVLNPGKTHARFDTRHGARTGLFAPELDWLIVAVPDGSQPAELRVFKFVREALH